MELPPLVESLDVPVFIGGRTSVAHRDEIVRAGARALGSDIELGLKRLGEILASKS
jgi:hypothetical protein